MVLTIEWNGVRQEVSFKKEPSERQLKLAFAKFIGQFFMTDIRIENDEQWQDFKDRYKGMIQQDMFDPRLYHVHEQNLMAYDNRPEVRL